MLATLRIISTLFIGMLLAGLTLAHCPHTTYLGEGDTKDFNSGVVKAFPATICATYLCADISYVRIGQYGRLDYNLRTVGNYQCYGKIVKKDGTEISDAGMLSSGQNCVDSTSTLPHRDFWPGVFLRITCAV